MSDALSQPLAAFIAARGLSMAVRPATSNRGFLADIPGSTHYQVTITAPEGAKMTVPFSMGPGLGPAAPTFVDVLSCLADDAAGYENTDDFEEWMAEYSYDDRGLARRVYAAVSRSRAALVALLGEEGYQQLLWRTTRM